MSIRPGLDPKWFGIKTPYPNKYRKFEKKLWSNFDYWTRSWSRNDRKIWRPVRLSNFTFFTEKALKSLFFKPFLNNQIPVCSIFHSTYPTPGFKPNFEKKKVKKVKPGLDPKSLGIKPRPYWQDFTVEIRKIIINILTIHRKTRFIIFE